MIDESVPFIQLISEHSSTRRRGDSNDDGLDELRSRINDSSNNGIGSNGDDGDNVKQVMSMAAVNVHRTTRVGIDRDSAIEFVRLEAFIFRHYYSSKAME